MKTRTKILLSVLGAFIIIVSVTAVFQWNNIKALIYYLRYSEEQITEFAQDNNELISSAMDKVPDLTIRDLTDDERKMLDSGEISTEEAVAFILGKNKTVEAVEPVDSGKSADTLPPDTDEEQVEDVDEEQTRVAELLAEIYILKARFASSLDGLKNSAAAEYKALPEDERTDSMKQTIGMKYLQLALGLEGECDGLMNNLLAEIETELKNTGGDLSLVSDIKTIYANEKSLKKAEYLSMYS